MTNRVSAGWGPEFALAAKKVLEEIFGEILCERKISSVNAAERKTAEGGDDGDR